MKLSIFEKIIGSAFFAGYIPFAPGTFGSLVAFAIYLIPGFENPFVMIFSISLFTIWGMSIASKFEKKYGKDPKQCVIDEVIGTWISLLFVPKILVYIIISFVIWRVLDILKPFPANYVEKLDGGLGIMLDDIISAIYTLILIQIVIYFF